MGECEGQAHQSQGGQVDSSTQAGPKIDILAETYNHQSFYAYQTKYPAKTKVSSSPSNILDPQKNECKGNPAVKLSTLVDFFCLFDSLCGSQHGELMN